MDDTASLTTHRIVVGIDGSDPSRRALVWAMEDAESRRVALEGIHVWHVPVTAMPMGVPVPPAHPDVLAREAKDLLEREIDRAEWHTSARPVIVRPLAIEGRPGTVLADEARTADLVVVGARGLGRIAGLLLGSVSAFCVRRSPVPVVVVPEPH